MPWASPSAGREGVGLGRVVSTAAFPTLAEGSSEIPTLKCQNPDSAALREVPHATDGGWCLWLNNLQSL